MEVRQTKIILQSIALKNRQTKWNLVPWVKKCSLNYTWKMISDLSCINYILHLTVDINSQNWKPKNRILVLGYNRKRKKMEHCLTRRWQYRLLKKSHTAVLVNPNMGKHHSEKSVSRNWNITPFFWRYFLWLWFIWHC